MPKKEILEPLTEKQLHCKGCPFPKGTICESAIPCTYNKKQTKKTKCKQV